MRNLLAIFNKEVRSYFYSPVAYVAIALFLGITGIFFYIYASNFAQLSSMSPKIAPGYQLPKNLNVNEQVVRVLLNNMSFFALMWLPLTTMKLYAEEKKSGTMELLLTAPITNLQTLLGKFFASLFLYVLILLFTLVYQVFLFIYSDPEWLPILIGYLGLFLMGSVYIAFGVLFSAITENQIVAAVSTFAFILFFWSIGWLASFLVPAIGELVQNFSLINAFDDFSKGILDSKNVIFYLSFTVMGIYLAYLQLESLRWRGGQ